jgi:hypothetical protein
MDVLLARSITTLVSAGVAVIGIMAAVVGSYYFREISIGCEKVFMC